MKKVVLAFINYPLAIAKYFEQAFRERNDLEVTVAGIHTGAWIPWNGGMYLPQKYIKAPDIKIPRQFLGRNPISVELINNQLDFEPDLFVTIDAGFYFSKRPKAKKVVHIATDSHVLDYSFQRNCADYFYNMHKTYSKPEDLYLPYCASKRWHYPEPEIKKDIDVVMIGLGYEHRIRLLKALQQEKFSLDYTLGVVYDEYRTRYAHSRYGVNWSSLKDLNARTFELMAMELPVVTNRIPDLSLHFNEGEHYLGFDTVSECLAKLYWLHEHPKEAKEMAKRGHDLVMQKHTYANRVEQILQDTGLL